MTNADMIQETGFKGLSGDVDGISCKALNPEP